MELENSTDGGVKRGTSRYGTNLENESKKCPDCGGALKSVGAGGFDCEKCGNNYGAEKWSAKNASDSELARMWDNLTSDEICELVPALSDKAACQLPPSEKMYPWAQQTSEVKRLWKEAYEDAHGA